MAIALVKQASNSTYATTLTTTVSTTTGNMLVAMVLHQSRASATVTDTAGNTWVLAGTTNTAGATSERLCSMFYCLAAGAITSATATVSPAGALVMTISEWSGVGSFRTASVAFTTTDPKTSPVTAVAGDTVIAMASCYGASPDTTTSGYTQLTGASVSTTYMRGCYRIGATAGSTGPVYLGAATVGLITAAFAPTVNLAPTANAGPDQTVSPGATVTLDSSASSDPDGTIASRVWTQTAGTTVTLSSTTATKPTFTAPARGPSNVVLTFSLVVTDNGGTASVADTVNITIPTLAAASFVRQATAATYAMTVTASIASTAGNTLVALVLHQSQASAAVTDTAGNTWILAATTNTIGATSERLASLYYCITAATVTSVTATVTGGNTAMLINVSEWSGIGSFDTAATASVDAKQAPVTATAGDLVIGLAAAYNQALTASSPYTALSGTNVSTTYLSGAYMLGVPGGSTGPTFTWPGTTGLVTAAFKPSTAYLAPIADAGPDQLDVEPWSTVTLTGAASTDPDGTIVSYAWTQTAGTTVTLSSATAVSPTFEAPGLMAGDTLAFALTVTDNDGAASPVDTITVVVMSVTDMIVIGGVLVPLRTNLIT